MSIEATLERVSAIRQALADPSAMIGSAANLTGGTEAPAATTTGSSAAAGSSFASALEQAAAGYASPSSSPQSAGGVVGASALSPVDGESQDSPGARIVAIAESQLGQAEQPPGSNESPAIAEYRTATAGAIPGAPWCAYFASWVARQAGVPLGEGGQGAGAVSEVWSWAQSTGRAIPNGPGVVPQPGDLIVFGDEHVGIVRDVLPNGQIQTIEGNYENKVAANVRSPTEATGYVNMGST
jgi:CHAP domain